jgi:selenide,water dikinase
MKSTLDEEIREIKLTQFSHGAGCGCKISPVVLDSILGNVSTKGIAFPQLLVGNADRDDAAVMDLGDGTAIISTTDFFMPIVDDPIVFGKIASANAISDIYAMGGKPLMAIAILGWPVNKLPPDLAGKVVEGAQIICNEAGIPLAGGHSIDSPEPIFGLAVTGRVSISNLKKNGGAKDGDLLFLTKPLGTGILSTAQKKGMLSPAHEELSVNNMIRLNTVGMDLGKIEGVHAMTDVTGFGLGGHLIEMCRASDTSAVIHFSKIPLIDPAVKDYIKSGNIPGGTGRNLDSYGMHIQFSGDDQQFIICDPQTSGGLLIAVDPDKVQEIEGLLRSHGLESESIGRMEKRDRFLVRVV